MTESSAEDKLGNKRKSHDRVVSGRYVGKQEKKSHDRVVSGSCVGKQEKTSHDRVIRGR